MARVPESDEGAAQEPAVDVWDVVSFLEDGLKRTGTITEMRGPLLQVAPHDGGPAAWVDRHLVKVL